MRQRVLALLTLLALLGLPAAAQSVFINEFHYDDDGADTGQFVEIAGPAGTNLSGWSLVLYNGNTASAATVYGTFNLSGVIPNQQGGFGTLAFTSDGNAGNGPDFNLQNGQRDGFALIDDNGTVIQLLSYEGTFTAADGTPAAGMVSTDIGVAETNNSLTPAGSSLHLVGTGTTYADFTWEKTSDDTPGSANTGQSFGGAPPPSAAIVDADIFINEADYRGSDPGDTFAEIVVGPGEEVLSTYYLVLYRASDGTIARLPDGVTPIILPVAVFTAGASVGDFDFYTFFGSEDFAQNLFANPGDAVALCKDTNTDMLPDALVKNGDAEALQFLSQNGTTTATEGCASGATSVDTSVEQPAGAPDGTSIGLRGEMPTPQAGSEYADFTPDYFGTPNAYGSTPGLPNPYQAFEEESTASCPAPFDITGFAAAPNSAEFVDISTTASTSLDGLYLVAYRGGDASIYYSAAYSGSTDGNGDFRIGDSGTSPDQSGVGFNLMDTNSGFAIVTREPVIGASITTYEYPSEVCALLVYYSTGNIVFQVGTPAPSADKRAPAAIDWEPLLRIMAAGEAEPEIPSRFVMEQNWPNPFNPTTRIAFALPEAAEVTLTVYDVLGREVARLVERSMEAGAHAVTFDASSLPSGVYLYRIQAGSYAETKRMTLLK